MEEQATTRAGTMKCLQINRNLHKAKLPVSGRGKPQFLRQSDQCPVLHWL